MNSSTVRPFWRMIEPTHCAPETTGSLLTRRPRPTRHDSSGGDSPRSRRVSSCKEIASRTLARASSRVLPWLTQPGRLGTSATTKPSSPGYNRTRRLIVLPQGAESRPRWRRRSPARLSNDRLLTATTLRLVTFDPNPQVGIRVRHENPPLRSGYCPNVFRRPHFQAGFPEAVVALGGDHLLA